MRTPAGELESLWPWIRWATGDALEIGHFCDLTQQVTDRLVDAGMPLDRVNITLPTLHPLVIAQTSVYRPGQPVEYVRRGWSERTSPAYLASPVYPLMEGHTDRIFADLRGDGPFAYEVYEEFRAEGFTGYAAFVARNTDTGPYLVSFCTKAPTGFTPAHQRQLEIACQVITPLLRIFVLRQIATDICSTYIGQHTGPRVLAGDIRRGSVERIDAVIWFCDLRGFTPLTENMEAEGVVAVLNAFFDILGGAIHERGGEILKFIGDAALAIFPVDDPAETDAACAAALQAARQVATAIDAHNARHPDEPDLAFGIGLHVGEVCYGNIGATERLDFTVIGQAVNLASRLEGLSARLDERVVASELFASHAPAPLRPLGVHPLKGVGAPQAVFGLPRLATPRPGGRP
jgi:adenylate cyclase